MVVDVNEDEEAVSEGYEGIKPSAIFNGGAIYLSVGGGGREKNSHFLQFGEGLIKVLCGCIGEHKILPNIA